MLVIGKTQGYADEISLVCNQLIANATAIDHATRLWHVLHAVIAGALDELKTELGNLLYHVMKTIERHVESCAIPAT